MSRQSADATQSAELGHRTGDHSPAPWEEATVDLDGAPDYGLTIIAADGEIVCDLYDHIGPCFERFAGDKANARLIAAAPDMYAALCAVMSDTDDLDLDLLADLMPDTVKMINAALLKADGLQRVRVDHQSDDQSSAAVSERSERVVP